MSVLNASIFQSASKAAKTIETKQKYVKIRVHFYNNARELADRLNVSVLECWKSG